MTSVRVLLRDAVHRLAEAGVESAAHDAGALLAHVLGVDAGEVRRLEILGRDISAKEAERYEVLVGERCSRVPLQHLTGRAPFRHLELSVGPGVFVPRPETEMLVDEVIARAPHGGRVVDLCTGSGAIALAVKQERPDLNVFAVELDEHAAAWAARNINDLGLDVQLSVEDAAQALPELEASFDVVVSNPPYIPVGMVPIDPEVAVHDPSIALYGGSDDGLRFPLRVAERASRLLVPGGHLVMEHADVQGETLPAALLDQRGFEWANDLRDAAGKPRVAVARREGGSRFEEPTDPSERLRRRRATVRLVVVDERGDVLLYEDSDQGMTPAFTWWSTPGGGVEPGEDARAAASRELHEETGARAEPDDFVGPLAERDVVHGYSDQIVEQHDVFYGLRVERFDVHPAGLTPEERLTMQQWRWWRPDELRATSDVVWPAQIPDLVDAFLRGERLELPAVEESSLEA